MCCQTYAWFTETGAVTQRVIKGHQIVVYGATSTCKNSWLALSRNPDAMIKLFENHSVDKVKEL